MLSQASLRGSGHALALVLLARHRGTVRRGGVVGGRGWGGGDPGVSLLSRKSCGGWLVYRWLLGVHGCKWPTPAWAGSAATKRVCVCALCESMRFINIYFLYLLLYALYANLYYKYIFLYLLLYTHYMQIFTLYKYKFFFIALCSICKSLC